MDPALQEALRRVPEDAEIEALALLRPGRPPPPELRIVTRFRDVVTCRVRAGDVRSAWASPAVKSLKAGRPVASADAWQDALDPVEPEAAPRRAAGAPTGEGVVVASLDWGCDFAHPSFRRADGGTRLRALWDQRAPHARDGNRYGYGRVLLRDRIDAALRAADPYAALGYHPSATRPHGGAHGTHVLDIAAGSGLAPGCEPGLAPGADLVFVHLATQGVPALEDLGDSVRIVEALDFALQTAGTWPVVVNLSLGLTGGDHSGRSLVERAMDALLEDAPGRAVVQSAGNYLRRRLHAQGTVRPGATASMGWEVAEGDPTVNELEVWYSGRDRLGLELASPGGAARVMVPLGEKRPVVLGGRVVGYAYHREDDPLTHDHHVDVFLEAGAPAGTWRVRLTGEDVVDGRYHAWIERDSSQPWTQSRFEAAAASARSTIGTIATGHRAIVVGAYDAGTGEPASFSSAGPTRDGRRKPDLVAPGVGIVAARSTPVGAPAGTGGAVRMSGTSMAAPWGTGAVALLFAAAGRKLNAAETRLLLLATARPAGGDPMREGIGRLDVEAALRAVARLGDGDGVAGAAGEANGSLDTEAALRAVRGVSEHEEVAVKRDAMGWGRIDGSPSIGTMRFEEALEAVLGSADDYDVVAWPGGPPSDTPRQGDVIFRMSSGPSPVVVRIADDLRPFGEAVDDVADEASEGEGDAEGWYASAEELGEAYRAPPRRRRVLDRRGWVPQNQVILRRRYAAAPVRAAVRPGGLAARPAQRPYVLPARAYAPAARPVPSPPYAPYAPAPLQPPWAGAAGEPEPFAPYEPPDPPLPPELPEPEPPAPFGYAAGTDEPPVEPIVGGDDDEAAEGSGGKLERARDVAARVERYSAAAVPFGVALAICENESELVRDAGAPTRAYGLWQIMPRYYADYGLSSREERADPELSTRGVMRKMKRDAERLDALAPGLDPDDRAGLVYYAHGEGFGSLRKAVRAVGESGRPVTLANVLAARKPWNRPSGYLTVADRWRAWEAAKEALLAGRDPENAEILTLSRKVRTARAVERRARPAEAEDAADDERSAGRDDGEAEWVDDARTEADAEPEDDAPPELAAVLAYLGCTWAEFAPVEARYLAVLGDHLRRAGVLRAGAALDRRTLAAAVREFQGARRLPATGIPDEDTLWALQRDWADARDLAVIRVPADRLLPGGLDLFRLRADVAERYGALRDEVLAAGGAISSAGSTRALDESRPSMHHPAIAFDLSPETGMMNPDVDRYVVTAEGRHWRVWCKSDAAPERTLDAVVWRGPNGQGSISTRAVRVKAFDFTELAARHGFVRIGRQPGFPARRKFAEWWHFQCEGVLTPYVSQFGAELLAVRSLGGVRYDEQRLSQYALWEGRRRIFGRRRNGWH